MVDGPSVGRDRPERGRPLVGHDHGVVAEEHRRHDGDGREDAGHRDVTVQEAELGRAQDLGVDPPLGPHHREAGDLGGGLDGGEAVAGPAGDEEGDVVEAVAHRLDRHDGVDPPAEGDERPARLGPVVDGGRPGPNLALEAQRRQVESVHKGELGQSLPIEGERNARSDSVVTTSPRSTTSGAAVL